jgi:hypothetical protein
MAAKKKHPKDTPEKQHARFVEAAYKVEADQATDALDKAFKKLSVQTTPSLDQKADRHKRG